ncbi:MAG TPA: TPM domain-containing protein [Azospira sp.]|nr:TPM domain-containing protein [Azospira sp.]
MTWLRRLALLLLLLGIGPAALAQDPLPVPALTERVIDQTGTLSATERQALIDKLAAFEAQAGPQIVVLIVATTAPEDIAAYAQRVGETWKIGRRDVGDGLLIVVAKNDRRLWIAPAKALEGAIPDLAARRIITEQITPRFRNNDYAGGIDAGVDALIARIRGENLPEPAARDDKARGGGLPLGELLIFAFVALPVIASVVRRIFGRSLGTLASGGAAGALAWLVTGSLLIGIVGGIIGLLFGLFAGVSNFIRTPTRHHGGWIGGGGWGGGGGGWGGGGGGFSSGGGGDFGGGGAGGSW